MRNCRKLVSLILPFTLALLPGMAAAAPGTALHVVGTAELQEAISLKVDQTSADRQAIRTLLERPQVGQIAARAGLNLTRAQKAVDVLSAQELAGLAPLAQQADEELAGGRTVVITSTAIAIVLLVVIIILVA